MNKRDTNEIKHGEYLSAKDTELIWGWGTPAGVIRAKRRAEIIAKGAMIGHDMHVLEIGCGTGMFTELFAQTGAYITAVDISANLLKKAEVRNLPRDKVQFKEKRFEDCEKDGPFDAIIGSSILHHLDTKSTFHKLFTMLKPNGVLSFAEPNMLNPQIFIERKFRRFFPHVSPDETAFIRWKLKHILNKAGFSDIKIKPFDWLHPSVPPPLIKLISKVGKTFEEIPYLCEFSGSLHIRAIRPNI